MFVDLQIPELEIHVQEEDVCIRAGGIISAGRKVCRMLVQSHRRQADASSVEEV
jgi:hypothetical protein